MVRYEDKKKMWVEWGEEENEERREEMGDEGWSIIEKEKNDGRIEMKELMDDIEEKGIDYVIVEGGEGVEKRFMDEKIVERMIILS